MGLVVAQRTETKDKIARMTSRFHRGQFYRKLSEKLPISMRDEIAYQGVIRVVTWLRHENDGHRTRTVVLDGRVNRDIVGGTPIIVEDI